jgi:two-component system sensor histidine kinase YesM
MKKRLPFRLFAFVRSVLTGWKLTTRLFIIIALITISMFIILQYKNMSESSQMINSQAVENAQLLAQRSNHLIDLYYENTKTVLLVMASQDWQGRSDEYIHSQIKIYADNTVPLVKTIYVNSGGKVYCSNVLLYSILGNEKINAVFSAPVQSSAIQVHDPYYASISGKTVAFSIPFAAGKANSGMVAAEINTDYLSQSLVSSTVSNDESFIITNAAGNTVTFNSDSGVIPADIRAYPPEAEAGFGTMLGTLPTGINYTSYSGKELMIVKSQANKLGWNSYIVVDQSITAGKIHDIRMRFAFSVALGIIFILISAFFLSYYFTNPIRKLAAKMDSYKMLSDQPLIDIRRNDEIGSLAKSYNDMVTRINGLAREIKTAENKEKEYELKMLQSQIAPHFLYNTLACIRSLARQNRISEVDETIRSLVGMLSFSFDRTSEKVPLRDELDVLKMYVQIQRIRYGSVFDMSIDVSEESSECLIPKLTLQPLIENSIFHGIIPKGAHGLICVEARIRCGILTVKVKDNGIGISKGDVIKLFGDRGLSARGNHFSSIGIRNIDERIRLNYGPEYGLSIRGIRGLGTVVKMTFPVQTD